MATTQAAATEDANAVDPITLEVIRHGIVSINDQIDADGRLIAQCNGGMPVFVADAVGAAVRDGLAVYGKHRFHPGDAVCIEAGGGGGYGSPEARPADPVALDVMRGYVSADSAARDYGVAILPDGRGVRGP